MRRIKEGFSFGFSPLRKLKHIMRSPRGPIGLSGLLSCHGLETRALRSWCPISHYLHIESGRDERGGGRKVALAGASGAEKRKGDEDSASRVGERKRGWDVDRTAARNVSKVMGVVQQLQLRKEPRPA